MKTNQIKMFVGAAALGLALSSAAPAARAMEMPQTMQFKSTLDDSLDKLFMIHSYQGNLAEVMTGKLALQKTRNPMVREVARTIVMEHGMANRDLVGHFKSMNMMLPKDAGFANQAVYDKLKTLKGAAFDKAYIGSQVGAHEAVVIMVEHEIDSGHNATIQQYAKNKLPGIVGHAAMLYRTAAAINAPGTNLRPEPVKSAAPAAAKEHENMVDMKMQKMGKDLNNKM